MKAQLFLACIVALGIAAAIAPNIVSNLSFETGWDGLVNGGYADPTVVGTTYRDTAHAFQGTYSIRRELPQTGWNIVDFTSATPCVVNAPGSNFSDGTRIGIYNTGKSIDAQVTSNSRYAKRIDIDRFAVYSDAALTVPVSTTAGTGGIVSTGDRGGDVFFPFFHGSPFFSYTPNPVIPAQTHDRVWTKFYFYFDDPPMNGILKLNLFFTASGQQLGGLYVFPGPNLVWFFNDWYNAGGSGYIASVNTLKGGWHSIETEYWRNGHPSGYPAVRIWLDGNQITWPSLPLSKPAPPAWPGFTDASSYLIAGYRLNSDPGGVESGSTTVFPGNNTPIGSMYWAGVLNGGGVSNMQTSRMWYEQISVSSLGPIGGAPIDTTPPVLSNGQPGSLTLPAATTSVVMNVTTDEAATCKYSTTANTAYASMTNNFAGATTTHSVTINSITSGTQYNYYVRCNDTSNNFNTNDYKINFTTAYFTPNIVNSASFENTWDGFVNNFATPSGYVSLDNTRGQSGSWAVKRFLQITPPGSQNDQGSTIEYPFYTVWPGGYTDQSSPHVWTRFYFYLDGPFDGIQKLNLYENGGNGQYGGTYLNFGNLGWAFVDQLNNGGTTANLAPLAGILNQWNCVETDYWRLGDTSNGGNNYPSMRMWLNGAEITPTNGNPGGSTGTVVNGRYNAGFRDLSDPLLASGDIGKITFNGLKNGGNTVAANIWVDNVSISTLGRIGGCGPAQAQAPDTTPPMVTITAPTTNQILSAGTTSTTLSVTTNEASTCKYSTTDQSYASMPTTMAGAASTSHSATLSGLTDGSTYTRYVRCQDTAGNPTTSSQSRTFSVDSIVVTQSPATVLFTESFENPLCCGNPNNGWFDVITIPRTASNLPGSTLAAEYHFTPGATNGANAGIGARLVFNNTSTVYLSYWVKYSSNWVGSNQPFHPHEFVFGTNEDSIWTGGASSNLTVYIEQNHVTGQGMVPVLGAQDGNNIDQARVGQDLSSITEVRAANGCNGNTDGYTTDCYGTPANNGKTWKGPITFTDAPGPGYKNNWHFVEAYYKLNSIQNGIGMSDGYATYWFDGQMIMNKTGVLFRTGVHTNMLFNELRFSPYIGSGSPIDQYVWYDNLTLATGRVGAYAGSGQSPPSQRPGDLNDDNRVDFNDMLIIIGEFRHSGGAITNSRADLNNDNIINLYDFILTSKHWGQTYP